MEDIGEGGKNNTDTRRENADNKES